MQHRLMIHIAVYLGLIVAYVSLASASEGFAECRKSFAGDIQPAEVIDHADICRDGRIAICYDINMINPAWSAYYVTPEDVHENIPGRDSFYEDPDLEAMGVAQAGVHAATFKLGYDRGHLAPSRIMSNDKKAKKATYTMANVAPQQPHFNEHVWEKLEARVFSWVGDNVALHIVTGVMYRDRRYPKRGKDGIAIPDYYFKVMCSVETKQSVGFYGENNYDGTGLEIFRTVREVELMFGGRFFSEDYCDTHNVDRSFWWDSDEDFATVRNETRKM